MSLQEKVLKLKLDALLAARHAEHWQKLINEHGEEKATAFYTHLGLNHLQKKGVEWEGLTLSREPKEHEKLCVKGIAGAQETAKEKIGKVLSTLRTELISDGLADIKKLEPATYHELTLTASAQSRQSLRDRLIKTYHQGRSLVAAELGRKEAVPEDEFDLLDDLVDITDSRVANDVQSRIIAATTRFRLLNLVGAALWKAVEEEIRLGSVSYIDRASTGLANRVINIGRQNEARERSSQWERVEYSALLDQNVCGPCAAEDGKEAENENDLTPVPNPQCEGGDWCRCFHIFVAEGNM